MKWVIALATLLALAGCNEKPHEVEPVGKYIIYQSAGVSGSIRLNTVSGEASMLIPSDAEIMHNGVTLDGKPLVWRKIATSQAQ